MLLFLNNFVAGVVASFVTVLLLELVRKWRLRRTYKILEGEYMHVDLENNPLLDGTTELQYLGRSLLSLDRATPVGLRRGLTGITYRVMLTR